MSDSSSSTEGMKNPPKRKRMLRKRNTDAGPSTHYSEDILSNKSDSESSCDSGDETWRATQTDYECDDDYFENSFSSIIEEKITIAANTIGTIGPQAITLCSIYTANRAAEENTVDNIIINNNNDATMEDATLVENLLDNTTATNSTTENVGSVRPPTTVEKTNRTLSKYTEFNNIVVNQSHVLFQSDLMFGTSNLSSALLFVRNPIGIIRPKI